MPVLYGGGYYAGGSAGGSGGTPGPSGSQGAQGLQGPQGISGVTGIQGPQGLQGITGLQGSTGLQGGTGLQGPIGAPGVTGIQGPTGLLGPTGLQGPSGARGLSGIQGANGSGDSTLVSMTDVVATGLSNNLGQSLFYHSGTNKYQFSYGRFPIWDIRDFGAVGDSSTDNTQAFINAGNALNASGGTLYIPASTGYYGLYINGNPGTGGFGTPYATNYYGVMRLNRDNLTIYSDPGAEVRAITNISLIETGNVWNFIVSATNLRRFNIINGKYSFEYASTGLYTTITDEANLFTFWAGLDSYRWNFINVTFSGYQMGNLNDPNELFRNQGIIDCLFYNCNFVDWGPGETDGLIYGQGRTIFDSCTFEITQARLDLAQKASHAMYIGSDRPYVRVKNNTFKKASPTNGKFCINMYSTNVAFDYSHNQIISNNTFIDCSRPFQTEDSAEFVTVKRNNTFNSRTADSTYNFSISQSRATVLLDNIVGSVTSSAETHETLCYRSICRFPSTQVGGTSAFTNSVWNLSSNNISSKFGSVGTTSFQGEVLGLSANNIDIKRVNSHDYDGVYSYIVNMVAASYGDTLSQTWITSMTSTGSVLHNVLAGFYPSDTASNQESRFLFRSSFSPIYACFNGVQYLNGYASGNATDAIYFSTSYLSTLNKNNVSFMRAGNQSISAGFAHLWIGNMLPSNLSITGTNSFYNTLTGSVYT